MAIADVAAALDRHRRILLTSHYNPDGDNIASQLALYHILLAMGKQPVIVDQDPVPPRYHYLPGWEAVTTAIGPQNATAACVLDCAGVDRIGRVGEIITPATMEIVNIDHHISNDGFGHAQYVDPQASSTCELVHRIAKRVGARLTPGVAACLLSGMMTDTGGFRYSSAGPGTLRVAAELMEAGAVLSDIAEHLYFEEQAGALQLLGELLEGMRLSPRAPLAWMMVTQPQLRKYGVHLSETEEYVRYALSVKGVEVGILFKEQDDGIVRASFRSKGRHDVNRLAKLFGGGGHIQAAGARVPGTLAEVEKTVIAAVEREMSAEE
jgi:phosphoesterase RecJ-like protein